MNVQLDRLINFTLLFPQSKEDKSKENRIKRMSSLLYAIAYYTWPCSCRIILHSTPFIFVLKYLAQQEKISRLLTVNKDTIYYTASYQFLLQQQDQWPKDLSSICFVFNQFCPNQTQASLCNAEYITSIAELCKNLP